MLNQLLRSGTSIGSNIHEANYAASKPDFINKFQIALKECYESDYWLGLFKDTKMITEQEYKEMYDKCSKIRKLLISSINTAKENTNIPYPSSIISAPSETTVDRYGDVNLSGSVEISDATDLQSYIAKYMGLSDRQLLVANVNMDNYVNIKDATYIQMYVARFIDTFPVNSY